jgi:6-phosphogluconolactonase
VARVTVVQEAAFANVAAQRIAALIALSISSHGTASVSLTGGSTPRAAYEALADPSRPWRTQVEWGRVDLFWGDERHVPPDHPDSNYGMANRALVQHVPVPPAQVHRILAELADARAAAADYARQLPDVFDVMLLGLGDDCHIASIFPGSELLADAVPVDRVAGVFVPHLDTWRITVTPPVILEARAILMLVEGEQKAAAVAAAVEGPLDVGQYPAQLLRRAGSRVEWLLDDAAAAHLQHRG